MRVMSLFCFDHCPLIDDCIIRVFFRHGSYFLVANTGITQAILNSVCLWIVIKLSLESDYMSAAFAPVEDVITLIHSL